MTERFWKDVTIAPADGGLEVRLDNRPVRTPGRVPLLLPTPALAEAVAAEWAAVEGKVNPAVMPLTGLANAATDHVMADPAHFVRALSAYAESDLLCYRAEHPAALVARQAAMWNPVQQMVEARFDLHFHTTEGVSFIAQPEATIAAVERLFAQASPWRLAALQPITSITGSAILALAALHAMIDAEQAFTAGALDELWQEEQWGADSEAVSARRTRQEAFDAAFRFLMLVE